MSAGAFRLTHGMNTRAFVLRQTAAEAAASALGPLGTPAALGATGVASLLRLAGRRPQALRLLMKAHSAALSDAVDRRILARLVGAAADDRAGRDTGLGQVCDETIAAAVRWFRASRNPDPRSLIGTRLMAVKRARPGERGVVVADYNYIFPLLAGLFDLDAITAKYFLVLEPGWNGYCSPDVLLFSRLRGPIFVETIEPRDREVLTAFGDPFRPVFPMSTNYWVDYRHAAPAPPDARDIDVIMVSAWARYKRHWRFFRALSGLRRRGRRLRVALVGYPADLTRDDILALARHYGIDDQIELHERIAPREVAALLGRSRVHVLWSRREGSNRAIIEAMLADVPTILREGFNFGYRYPHINPQTGLFVREADLADAMLHVLDDRRGFAPRAWALSHITCQHATAALERAVRAEALRLGEPWTEGLAVRLSTLDTQDYWDPTDRGRFDADHAFLATTLRADAATTAAAGG